jgi:mannitol/fructose-specific phosphotransferase system IIA component (Ntr-type)
MGLQGWLRPELVKVPLEAEKKIEAVSELLDLLVQNNEVPMSQRHNLMDDFAANESAIGHGLERGIAMPTIVSDRVEDLILALGVSHDGVNFANLDDRPAKVVLLALVPKKTIASEMEHLRDIEQVLEHKDLIERLIAAKTGKDAYIVLSTATATV